MKGLFLGWSSFSGIHPKVVVIVLPSRTNHLKQYPSVSQDPSLHTSAWSLFDSEVELHFRISLWNSKFSSLGVQSSWILLSCADLSLAEPSSWFNVPQTQCLKPEKKIKDLHSANFNVFYITKFILIVKVVLAFLIKMPENHRLKRNRGKSVHK